MNNKSRIHLWLASAGILLLLATLSGSGISPAYAGHCDKKPNHPHCTPDPGGDGNTHTPLNVTFRDAAGDLIRSDGGSSYQDGVDKVTARITKSGHFLLNVGAKNKPPARNVFFDFSNGGNPAIVLGEFSFNDTNELNNEYGSIIQVNRRGASQGFGLLDMNKGPTIPVDFWTDLRVFDAGHDSSVLIRYDAGGPGAQNDCTAVVSVDINITRISSTQWIINAPAGALACVRTFDPTFGTDSTALYSMAPFQIQLDIQQ